MRGSEDAAGNQCLADISDAPLGYSPDALAFGIVSGKACSRIEAVADVGQAQHLRMIEIPEPGFVLPRLLASLKSDDLSSLDMKEAALPENAERRVDRAVKDDHSVYCSQGRSPTDLPGLQRSRACVHSLFRRR